MSEILWHDLQQSYEYLKNSKIEKIEGNGWTMYKVGTIIRIDIKETK